MSEQTKEKQIKEKKVKEPKAKKVKEPKVKKAKEPKVKKVKEPKEKKAKEPKSKAVSAAKEKYLAAKAKRLANAKPHPKLDKIKKFLHRINTKRMRIIGIIVLVIIAFFVVKAIITNRAEKMAVFNVTPTYETVTRGDIAITIAGDGNLSSGTSMNYDAVCDLAVDQVLLGAGSVVSAGDVIATLDADGMNEILKTLSYSLEEKQTAVDKSDDTETTYYILAPESGRLKDIQVEEDDTTDEAIKDPGYLAIISTVDEMKIEVTEAEYNTLSSVSSLVIRTEGYRYSDDISLRIIDDKYYVILPTAMRTIGAEASVYSAAATKVGNELATGTLELVDYVYVKDTEGTISLQDDFENYWVEKGEVLFHIDKYSYSLEQAYDELATVREQYDACLKLADSLQLVAPTDGIVGTLNIANNTTLPADSTIATMYSDDDWVASVSIDELDINSVEVGQSAVVTIDALDYGEFDATVESISSSGSASGGITTYDVVLAVDDNDLFKLAMTVTCEIEVQSSDNTLLISSDSLRTTGTVDYVLVKADRTLAEKAEIRKAILKNDFETLSKYISVESTDTSETTATSDSAGSESGPVPSGASDQQSGPMPSGASDQQSGPMPSGGMDGASGPMPSGMSGGMDSGDMPTMSQSGSNNNLSVSLSNLVELLYGNIVVVEAGLDDGTNVEILSGLSEGDEVLIPITTDEDDESSGFSFNMFGGGGGATSSQSGGGGGGGQMPSGGGGGGEMPAGGGGPGGGN